MYVLEGDLRLSDTAQPVQGLRLWQYDGHPAAQLVAKFLQDRGAANEAGVAGGSVPDPGYGPGEAWPGRDRVGELYRPLQCPKKGVGGVHFVEPEEVDGVAVDERTPQPYVTDAQRQQLTTGSGRVLCDRPLPDLHGAGGLQVGAGEDEDSTGRAFLPCEAVGGDRFDRDVARHDPESGALEHGPDPVGPHPVLGDVAEQQVGGDRRPAACEGVPDPQPDLFGDRRHGGDAAAGYLGDEPFEGGEKGVGESGLVAEGRQGLLVRVVGPVRDLHRAPVGRRLIGAESAGQPVELHPRQGPSGSRLLLLTLVDTHGDGEDLDRPVALVDLAGDGGRAVDGLVAEGEAVDEDVRKVDGADVGDVAEAGAAVDEDVVVIGLHVLAQGVEKVAAAEPVVEVIPVEGGDCGGVLAVLASRRDEVQGAAAGKFPAQCLGGE